jgi:hypothetical protein
VHGVRPGTGLRWSASYFRSTDAASGDHRGQAKPVAQARITACTPSRRQFREDDTDRAGGSGMPAVQRCLCAFDQHLYSCSRAAASKMYWLTGRADRRIRAIAARSAARCGWMQIIPFLVSL